MLRLHVAAVQAPGLGAPLGPLACVPPEATAFLRGWVWSGWGETRDVHSGRETVVGTWCQGLGSHSCRSRATRTLGFCFSSERMPGGLVGRCKQPAEGGGPPSCAYPAPLHRGEPTLQLGGRGLEVAEGLFIRGSSCHCDVPFSPSLGSGEASFQPSSVTWVQHPPRPPPHLSHGKVPGVRSHGFLKPINLMGPYNSPATSDRVQT